MAKHPAAYPTAHQPVVAARTGVQPQHQRQGSKSQPQMQPQMQPHMQPHVQPQAPVQAQARPHVQRQAVVTNVQPALENRLAWPAKKIHEAVRWHGIDVAAVNVRYYGVGEVPQATLPRWPGGQTLPATQVAPAVSSDSDEDRCEVADEFDPVTPFGQAKQAINLGTIAPMSSLVSEHSHNPNLVRQFEELARTFSGWRPVRGDGNCYYRAVLFAWLERCIALGTVDRINFFSESLKQFRDAPVLAADVRLCRRLLKTWIVQRSQCTTEAQVRTLLNQVGTDFEKGRIDRAFIHGLRHLIARYLLQHAHEPIQSGGKGGASESSDSLTYEQWAAASGEMDAIKNLQEYCDRVVCVMDTDAADLVQYVCPRVLRTIVRICMVDRQTERANFFDHGEGASPAPSQMSVPAGAPADTSGLGGAQPEIFLLLKPGHYDILIKKEDGVAKLVCSDLDLHAFEPSLPGGRGSNGDATLGGETPAALRASRHYADARWKNVVKLMHDILHSTQAALQCLEEKVVEELDARKKRCGKLDEQLFEGTLTSVLDPLRDQLARFHCVPDDSPFSADKEAPRNDQLDALSKLLPKLAAVLKDSREQSSLTAPSDQRSSHDGAGGAGASRQHQKRSTPVAVEVQVGHLPTGRSVQPAPSPLAAPPCAAGRGCQPGSAAAGSSQGSTAASRHAAGASAHTPTALSEARPIGHATQMQLRQMDEVAGYVPASHATPAVAQPPDRLPLGRPSGQSTMRPSDVANGRGGSSGLAAWAASQTLVEHRAQSSTIVMDQAPPAGDCRLSGPSAGQTLDRTDAWSMPPTTKMLSSSNSLQGTLRAQPPTIVVDQAPPVVDPRLSGPSAGQSPGAWSMPPTTTMLSSSSNLRRPAGSMRHLPQIGNLGAALGIPCLMCYGEDGTLKTLHCGYKVHVTCLREHWYERVNTLCKMVDIRCPAEVEGCPEYLGEADLRGVVTAEDLVAAQKKLQVMDAQNQELIEELNRQNEEYRPMFQCAICLVEHEVEGCCTLPCQHRFCFESLQHHFNIIVRERRLNRLVCPADGCGFNLRSEEYIHIFQQCLPVETYHKLLEFLSRDIPNIHECKHPGCEERIFLDDGDDCSDLVCHKGHRFCGKCENGPHPGISCEDQQEKIDRERKAEEELTNQEEAWKSALALGWKPCPRRCTYGGGYKNSEECDHVTCECGFEFCWDCGVDRRILLNHDNRWHKPSCRYHTRPEEVSEVPRRSPNCPACAGYMWQCCPFSQDDGYPGSYVRRRRVPLS